MGTSAPLLNEPLPVELMNTIWADRYGVHDALSEPDGAQEWLRSVAPRLGLVTVPDLEAVRAESGTLAEQLTALRDALRRLAAEATHDPRPAAASATAELNAAVMAVNEAAGAAPRWPALTWAPRGEPSQSSRTSGSAAAAAVSAVAGQAIDLFSQGDRLRLRACLAPGCVLYFVKNHPRREWCSPACGNRARGSRFYQRHRQTAS